jgi:hypothetical protein
MLVAKSLLTTGFAGCVLLLGAAPSMAGSETVRDPGGDVLSSSPPDEFPPT